jgi:hypothetical protein
MDPTPSIKKLILNTFLETTDRTWFRILYLPVPYLNSKNAQYSKRRYCLRVYKAGSLSV